MIYDILQPSADFSSMGVFMTNKRPVFLLLLLLAAVLPSFAYPNEIKVKHDKFDHFNIVMPEQISAGTEAQIKLEIVDSLSGVVSDFGGLKRSFKIHITGSATVSPASFDSDTLPNGTLIINFNDKTAEAVILSITESDNPLPIVSREFLISPNKLSSLSVKGPRTVFSGERFELRVIGKDAFGNIASEPVYGKNLNISFSGTAKPKIETPLITEFRKGSGVLGFIAEKAGTVAIEIKDMATGISGTSELINIKNGPLHSFRIQSPGEVIAGEPFDFSISPVDRFGNVISDYSSTGKGVVITSSGKQKPFPSTIPASEFVKGQVKTALRYDGAETVRIGVTEKGANLTGESESIVFVAPTPERFEIITPDSVIAGQKFKIKIIVYNQLSHIIRNYSFLGTDVLLSTTGTGTMLPGRVRASEFIKGVAIVEVQYNKAEAFEIIATAEKAKESKKAVDASVAILQQVINKEEKTKSTEVKNKLEIKNISVREGKDKATLTIHMDNTSVPWKYRVDTEEKYDGKKWIIWVILKINPAVSKIKKVPRFASSLVGNIVVEKDKKDKDAALVKIKLLKPARYNIVKKNNSLEVELTR